MWNKNGRFWVLGLLCLLYLGSRAQCSGSLIPIPSSCNAIGGYSLVIPSTSACAQATPYSLFWGTSGCQTPTLSGIGCIPGPGTFVITFTAGCITPYNVVFQDNNGNFFGGASASTGVSATSSVQITPLTATLPACFGDCNGARSILWSGTGPITATIDPATTFSTVYTNILNGVPKTFTALCAGTHTFAATDANNCTYTTGLTFTIGQPPALTASTSFSNPACNGGNNGTFSVSPTGGTPNYTVVFSNSNTVTVTGAGTATVGGLSSGVITATVIDSKNCTFTVSATLSQPPAMVITPSQINADCPGSCNGSASVAVTGGGGTYNYTWSPGPGNSAGITGLCAGSHTVSILDNLNCLRTQTFTVTQPTSITLATSVSNLSCNASCNGSANVTASGPTTAITFTWLATGGIVISTSSSITARCAGIYTVIAKDAATGATCNANSTISITQPPALTITAITQSITCITNTCSGSATANVSGGNGAPFSYSWTPTAQTTSVANSLCTGSYTVAVTDGSNCVTSTVVAITEPPTFTPAITSGSLSCNPTNAACNGSINANPTGGTAPYSYTLLSAGAPITSAPPYTNLCAGTYTLIIKDSSPATCGQAFTVSLTQPNALIPSISTTSITCFNVCNGALGGNATGGTPTYTMSWATPSGTVAGSALTGRCAGVYTLTVRDVNNCTATATSSLTQPTDMTLSINPTNVNCFGSCNGVLSGLATGGTPGYTLNWSNGFTGNPNIGLCAGAYTLTTTDANGCVKTGTAAVGSPSAIVMTQSTTATSCAASCDGSATITATGGTTPYTFNFNTTPPTTNTTGIISGLCAGNYIASISDANSCPQAISFSITSPALLSAAITGTLNSCTACTGAATVTASNGTPGYTFAWTNSLNVNVSSVATASGLCTGNYTVTVTDTKACVATATVGIQQTVISAVVSGGTGIQCFGACSGSAVVSPSGGTAPYNFTWSPSAQTTQTATNLCAGNYTVTIQEQGGTGCTSAATIAVTQPSSITVTTNQANNTCFGSCNGSMVVTPTGGTGAMTFSWSPGGQTTSSLTNQCAGNYTVRVADGNGCTVAPQTFSLTQPTSITATFNNTTPTGCTLSNGSICAVPSGGSGAGYTFTWSPATGSTSCITGLSSGAYSVIIRDGTGVCTTTLSTVLNSPAGPTITVTQQSVTCFGASTGSAVITAAGTPAFSYTWTPAVTTSSSASTSSATGLNSGTYIVSVRDGNSCVTNQTVNIAQPSSVTVISNVGNPLCNTSSNGSISVVPSGGTPGYAYNWSGPGAFTATTQNVSSLSAGNYSLIVTDNNNCPNNFTFTVTSPPALTLTTASTKTVICAGVNNGSIVANATGGTAPLSYTWLPLGAFTGSSTATVLNLAPGNYTVNAIDGNNCIATSVFSLAPSTLTTGVVLQNASCSGSCNAAATHTVSGGTPTYSFSWSSSALTTSSIGALCTGNYTATVVDADGCISAVGFTVTPPPTFSITVTPSQPKCNATCDGSIATTPVGAQGTVNYNWAPAGSGQNPTNLCAGVYTLIAVDNSSCQATSVITLTNPAAILSNVTFTNPLCNNNCNGIAVSTPTNAVGVVSYTWLPSGSTVPTTQTSLCAGTYTVLIQDGNGCQDTQTFTLNNPPVLSVNTALAPSTCGASNGSVTVIASGGTPGYTYTWSPAVSTSSVATGLSAQIFTVLVSDNANCTNSVTIPLSNSNGPTAPITATNVLCNGASTGAASVGVMSGGTPPLLTPVWITPPPATTVNALSNVPAGNYTVQLEDAVGCKTFTGVTITQPASISITPNMGLPTCNGICNGSISVNVSGGVLPYTYSWSPAAPNSSVLTSLCAGDYTLDLKYNGTCSTTQTFNIPAQVNLTFSDNIVPNNCFGNCNGASTVVIVPTAGIPSPFTFNWSNGQFGPGPFSTSLNSLCTGVYSVTATGANGCFNTHTVDITSPPQLTLTTAVSQPSCNMCNGSASVTPGGGAGGTYTLNWGTGATTTVIANLCAGIYPVTILDNLGCQQSQTVVINNSNGITGENTNTQDIPCGSTCSGAATVQATGGNPPIAYNWISPAVSGSVVSNLCPGTYFVQMQDAQGCLRNASVSINAATNITLSPFITPPACGQTNGTISVLVSGGTPTFNFSWLPVSPATATLNNVGPGSYTLTVTDGSPGGCPTSQAFNISNQNAPLIGFTPTQINCFNACTGAVSTNITGTATPFTYNWSVGGNTPNLSNLCKGVITLTVTDSNSCIAVSSTTLTDNPQLQAGIPQVTQPTCNQCNGAANINGLGGVAPYTYSWTTGASGASQSSLCAGLYQVVITDQLNCQQTQNVVINNSNGITGETFAIQNITCAGSCNGGATVTPVGGTTPIFFSWVNPVQSSTINAVTGLCAGSYFVQMTDAKGCKRTSSLSISPVNDFSVTSNILQPSCGSNNGAISLQVNGGTAPYSYSWTPSAANSPTLNNVGPGVYVVAVTDQNGAGCVKTQTFSISNITAPSLSFTQTNINCFGTCTGSISVASSSAGTTFNWSNGGTGASVSNLCEGIITLTATSTGGCKTVRVFTITSNPELEFNSDIRPVSCLNTCDGVVTLLPVGGKLIYTFSVSGTSTISNNVADKLCSGTYSFLISDASGCVLDTVLQLKNPVPITSTLNSVNSSCSSLADGSASVNVSGGTPSYTVGWTGPSGFTASTPAINNILAGSYTLSMTDSLGCKKDSVLTIVTTLTIDANAGRDTIICPRGSLVLNGLNSVGAVKYEWYELPNATLPVASTGSFTMFDAIQNYTYQLVATASVAGCFDKDTVVVSTFVEPYVEAGPSFTIPVFSTVIIGGNPTLTGPESVTWTPSFYLNDASLQNPVATNTISITYTANVMFGNGCIVSDTMRVELYPEIIINNGFSPNNDGKNDRWLIDYLEQFPDNTVEIYNRWGEQLFFSRGYTEPFDGTYKGKNLPVGTYYYVIHLNHPAYPKPYTGPLTIFR